MRLALASLYTSVPTPGLRVPWCCVYLSVPHPKGGKPSITNERIRKGGTDWIPRRGGPITLFPCCPSGCSVPLSDSRAHGYVWLSLLSEGTSISLGHNGASVPSTAAYGATGDSGLPCAALNPTVPSGYGVQHALCVIVVFGSSTLETARGGCEPTKADARLEHARPFALFDAAAHVPVESSRSYRGDYAPGRGSFSEGPLDRLVMRQSREARIGVPRQFKARQLCGAVKTISHGVCDVSRRLSRGTTLVFRNAHVRHGGDRVQEVCARALQGAVRRLH